MTDTNSKTAWEPIETAPKDGKDVLVGWVGAGVTVSHWSVLYNRWHLQSGCCTPTHWMPLPPAPSKD